MDHIFESIASLGVNVANTSTSKCWWVMLDEDDMPNSLIK